MDTRGDGTAARPSQPYWVVPQDPTGPRQARKATRQQLFHWNLRDHSETAELLVSELVTNAVLHGCGPIRLRLKTWHGTLRCEVTDSRATLPEVRPLALGSEGGRGMHLLDMLAQQWGVRGWDRGKTVWFELATCTEQGCCRQDSEARDERETTGLTRYEGRTVS